MLSIVFGMILILLVAGVVVAYVAYPHRGQAMPAAPWLGQAMRKGVDRLPTLEDSEHAVERKVASGR